MQILNFPCQVVNGIRSTWGTPKRSTYDVTCKSWQMQVAMQQRRVAALTD